VDASRAIENDEDEDEDKDQDKGDKETSVLALTSMQMRRPAREAMISISKPRRRKFRASILQPFFISSAAT